MKLETGAGIIIRDPSEEEIESALASMAAITDEMDRFVILGDDAMFVQCAGNEDGTFVLEFQIGDTSNHHRCPTQSLTPEQVIDVFKRFLRREPGWNQTLPWDHVPM